VRIQRVPIGLVVFIGLVFFSGIVAGVSSGESGVNTTVPNGTAMPIGEIAMNTTVSMDMSADLNGIATTTALNSSPTQSARISAEIPGELPLLSLATGGIALLAGGTGLFFWRRRRGREEKEPEQEVPPVSEVTPVAVTEDLRETARSLAAGELRKGIEAVYLESLVRLNQQQPGARLLARTPREIREQFEGTPIATPITAMTAIYEAVVYSGRRPVEKDRGEMIDLFVTVFSGSERADR
jgi:hypothetical protein